MDICVALANSARMETPETEVALVPYLRQTIDETKASWAAPRHRHAGPRAGRAPNRQYRVAFLIYRGNPRCGGQASTPTLDARTGQTRPGVEVFSGPPWPELDEGVGFRPCAARLYRDPDPFRIPARASSRPR